MDIIGKRKRSFAISGTLILMGLVFLVFSGLLFAIDFTGGSRLELHISSSDRAKDKDSKSPITNSELEKIVESQGVKVVSVKKSQDIYTIRTEPIEQRTKEKILNVLEEDYETLVENSFETVGPLIGRETKNNAVKAVFFAIIAITAYIAFAFREVSNPVSSWKFGISAIIALIHDVLIVVGVFAVLGRIAGVEVDVLFITALLTVMGFSVHDTIVVFDRIRENLKKNAGLQFEEVLNKSVLETITRSLNTTITVVFVLLTLLLFGGESIRWFVVALLVGIVVGTYSSIFIASPLLLVWHNWDKKRAKKQE